MDSVQYDKRGVVVPQEMACGKGTRSMGLGGGMKMAVRLIFVVKCWAELVCIKASFLGHIHYTSPNNGMLMSCE